MNLTEQQQKFCDEYLIDLNATQAAIRAGYSAKTAAEQSSRLLRIVKVRNQIDKLMAERSKRTGVNQDRVIRELAKIAFVNPNDVINIKDGSVKENANIDDLACIQSIKVKTVDGEKGYSEEREVRLNDKMKALELLGKHLGIFTEKIEEDLNVNIVVDYGDGEGKGSRKVNDSMAERLSELLDEINEYIEELDVKGLDVINMLDKMQNPVYRQILSDRYIEGIPLKEIAEKPYVKKDYKYLVNMHGEALKEFDEVCVKYS